MQMEKTAMSQYKSEIRESDIKALLDRVREGKYDSYLREIRLVKLRGFSDVNIRFDFPVTALVGPNGGGKTTILGAAGLAYKSVPPRRFFAKSGDYDKSMLDWTIEYNVIDKSKEGSSLKTRTASYRRAKWSRDAFERTVVISGVERTLPASERKNLHRFIKGDFSAAREIVLSPKVLEGVQKILGKDPANYLRVDADQAGKNSIFAVRSDELGGDSYSEFHFGAGEASIIRIVSSIEEAPENSLLLIEEIENGLHPVATRRLVEQLISTAKRKSCQIIFTTHSNDALAPLPSEAVWSASRGRVSQGKLDVTALRTLVGDVEASLAVFTEDSFGRQLAEYTLRDYCARHKYDYSSIEIHALSGAAEAQEQARYNNINPVRKFPAIALLDGDMKSRVQFAPQRILLRDPSGVLSQREEDNEHLDGCSDTVFGPGEGHPEQEVFDDIYENLDTIANLLGKLTIALHLRTEDQEAVRRTIEERRNTNRDPHVLFAQIGEDLDFRTEEFVGNAFLGAWVNAFPEKVDEIWDPCAEVLSNPLAISHAI